MQKINEATPEPAVEKKKVPGPRSMAKAIKKAKLESASDMDTTTKSELESTKVDNINRITKSPAKVDSSVVDLINLVEVSLLKW